MQSNCIVIPQTLGKFVYMQISASTREKSILFNIVESVKDIVTNIASIPIFSRSIIKINFIRNIYNYWRCATYCQKKPKLTSSVERMSDATVMAIGMQCQVTSLNIRHSLYVVVVENPPPTTHRRAVRKDGAEIL